MVLIPSRQTCCNHQHKLDELNVLVRGGAGVGGALCCEASTHHEPGQEWLTRTIH